MTNEKQIPLANKKEIEVEFKPYIMRSMIEFMVGLCVDQAIPSATDGQKPVHRRILNNAHEEGLMPNKPYKKAVHLVGSTLSKYHPKGINVLINLF